MPSGITKLVKPLSVVLAPTVRIHGDTFDTVPGVGPTFPAEETTTIPRSTAWNAPTESASLKNSLGSPPTEIEITSTPSSIAASKAAKVFGSIHSLASSGQQTL
ncbi:hypothetical protein IC582_014746 [Cucumis melo]